MSDWTNDRTPGSTGTSATAPHDEGWRVVIPVKGGPTAKSRLRVPDGVDRMVLARAFALDTVAAAGVTVGVERVLVVTSDAQVASGARSMGASAAFDAGLGLNSAITAGLEHSPAGGPVAVLLGDIPAVRPADVAAALRAAAVHEQAFVPDAEGTGTVLLAARSASRLVPRFGRGSAAAHEQGGATRLELLLPRLRRDVDDEASLQQALVLGVGRHTAALLAHVVPPARDAACGVERP
jgi:2-phospho-L-lactate/phosphoenolpyruvate guanylyltransferase